MFVVLKFKISNKDVAIFLLYNFHISVVQCMYIHIVVIIHYMCNLVNAKYIRVSYITYYGLLNVTHNHMAHPYYPLPNLAKFRHRFLIIYKIYSLVLLFIVI